MQSPEATHSSSPPSIPSPSPPPSSPSPSPSPAPITRLRTHSASPVQFRLSVPDMVQTCTMSSDVSGEQTVVTEYIIEGLDQGSCLLNSALAKYEIVNSDGTYSLSHGQLLHIPTPLSVNTFDGFNEDEEEEDVLLDSDGEWPYCSRLYSEQMDEVPTTLIMNQRRNHDWKPPVPSSVESGQCLVSQLAHTSNCTHDYRGGEEDDDGWSSERTLIDDEEEDKVDKNEELIDHTSLSTDTALEGAQEEQTLVDLTYLTMKYGIPPETVQHYQVTNPDPDGPFGPYGTYGLDWFLIPHYPDFNSVQDYQSTQNLETLEHLRVDVEMMEQEAQQALVSGTLVD